MSYDPIVEGSEATPGLWNRRFASIWSSLGTLSSDSSGGVGGWSSVTALRATNGWAVESNVSAPSLSAVTLSLNTNAGAIYGRGVQSYWGLGSDANARALVINNAGNLALMSVNTVGILSVNSQYAVSDIKVVGDRKTGWTTVPTGTVARTTFATSTATLGDLAQRLAALIIDLTAHGLIGP